MKISVAIFTNQAIKITGLGVLIFDHTGRCRGARGSSFDQSSIEAIKREAATEAYNWTVELGSRMDFESNSCQLIKMIRSRYAAKIGDRFTLQHDGKELFEIGTWSTINDRDNHIAVNLARLSSNCNFHRQWDQSSVQYLIPIISGIINLSSISLLNNSMLYSNYGNVILNHERTDSLLSNTSSQIL